MKKQAIFALIVLLTSALPVKNVRADINDPNADRLLEAQLLALEVEGQLRPSEEITEQIYNDLFAIRSNYPEIAFITYMPRAVPDEIMIGLTAEAAEQFRNGQYHALDELNETYGVIEIDSHLLSFIRLLILKFDQIYNTELLSQIYADANLPGVRYAEPNYRIGDGSTIIAEPPYYCFVHAWGDCPSGCIYREYWYFKVEDGQVRANELYVDAENGDDDNLGFSPETTFATIQKGVDSAKDGGTVIVLPGTYTGEGNRDIDPNGKAVTIRSTNPNDPDIVAATIIDCNGSIAEPHRAFYFHNGEDANTILNGLTITNGYAGVGGGIYCEYSSPAITNCTFTDNWAGKGGAMFSYNSEPVVVNCTFTCNSSEWEGGAMFNAGSNPAITNCTFTNNSAEPFGGAMYNRYSEPIITNCSFSGNSAGFGGAIYNHESYPAITNCTFTGNLAHDGGAIRNIISNPVITNCTFRSNSALVHGGAMADKNSDSVVTNCTFTGNVAELEDVFGPSYGSAMLIWDGNATVTNCTFTNNSAEDGCGAICNFIGGSSVVTNCILWGNTPDQIVSGSLVTYSNVQGGWDGVGNIDIDPCFVDPCDGDFHLKSEGWSWDIKRNRWAYDDVTSRCIDAGNPGCPLGDEPMSVPDDPNNTWGENIRINMGAYGGTAEASIPPYDWTLLADLTNDGIVNFEDYAGQVIDWSNSGDCQPGDLNRDGVINMPDLVLLIEDWLKETAWH